MKAGRWAALCAAALLLGACDGADDAEDANEAPGPASIADEESSPASGLDEIAGDAAAIDDPAAVEDDPPPEPDPDGFGMALYAGDWAVDAAACATDGTYQLRERIAFLPAKRCVLISIPPAAEGEPTADAADTGRIEVQIYCEPGRDGPPPIGWPIPEADHIDPWIIEALGEASPATSIRLDLGDGVPIDLIRCGVG